MLQRIPKLSKFWPFAFRVCIVFIHFLHKACNFQDLILGWSTLLLGLSIAQLVLTMKFKFPFWDDFIMH